MPIKLFGPLGIDEIALQFGGEVPHSLDEYYAGGIYVELSAAGARGVIPSANTIDMSVFYGASNTLNKGAFVGGTNQIGPPTLISNAVQSFDFINETLTTVSNSALFNQVRHGVNSKAIGYLLAGLTGQNETTSSVSDSIERHNFADSTTFLIANLVNSRRYRGASTNSLLKGYIHGGLLASGSITSSISGFTFSNETSASTGQNLLDGGRLDCRGVSSSTRGYCLGGRNTANVISSAIDGIQFSTETAVNPVNALNAATEQFMAVNSKTKGYTAGGVISGPTTTNRITSFSFDTESSSLISAVLADGSRRNFESSAINSDLKGFFAGGIVSGSTLTNAIDGLIFSNEASYNIATVLSSVRTDLSGIQSDYL